MNIDELNKQLFIDEGVRLMPYTDSVGKLTIGVGHNLERGISHSVAEFMLRDDIWFTCNELDKNISWWRSLSEKRQQAIANMCFNLGIGKLIGFKKTLDYLKNGDYNSAADEMLDSKWAKQVGSRAYRLSEMIRNG